MHNGRRSLRRVALAAPLALAACSLFDQPAAAPVVLTIHAPATAQLGDSVAVRVTIENRAGFSVTYQGNLCPRFFRVVNTSGEDAGPPFVSVICPAIDVPRTLAAREQHEYSSYWLAHTHGPRFEPIVVDSGSYRIEPVIGISPVQGDHFIDIQRVASRIIVLRP